MSEKNKKMAKAADAPAPGEAIAVQIIKELERVHIRVPRY